MYSEDAVQSNIFFVEDFPPHLVEVLLTLAQDRAQQLIELVPALFLKHFFENRAEDVDELRSHLESLLLEIYRSAEPTVQG